MYLLAGLVSLPRLLLGYSVPWFDGYGLRGCGGCILSAVVRGDEGLSLDPVGTECTSFTHLMSAASQPMTHDSPRKVQNTYPVLCTRQE